MERLRALWRGWMENPRFQKLWQFVKFGVVGCSNTLVSLGVYQLCVHVFGMHYLLSNALAFLLSVTNAYFWNSRYVFSAGRKRSAKEHLSAYLRSVAAYGSTFLLDSALLVFWVELCGVSETLAPFLNLLITIPLNFLLNKYWAFKDRGGKREEREE